MDPEQKQLLTLASLPARLNAEQTAQFLGFQPHDVPVLVAAGLLRPLGRPSPNSTKYFATVELEEHRRDVKWLAKATDAVQSHWRRKNGTLPPSKAHLQRPNAIRSLSIGGPLTGEEMNE